MAMTNPQAQGSDVLKPWQPLAQQAVFRQLMRAFSYPGKVEVLCQNAHDTQDAALPHVLATLLDAEVTLADPDNLLDADLLTLLEARVLVAERAQFIVARADRAPQFTPMLGSLESPEQGATVILRVACVGEGSTLHLSGPGVNGSANLQVRGLDPKWLAARSSWNAGFPLGVDMILVDGQRAVALPRTTRISCKGDH
jgi:alpha-D-ribose 1-methylphosphonate 5-triphosphate synthase subunit PhnH